LARDRVHKANGRKQIIPFIGCNLSAPLGVLTVGETSHVS
jgi:hypothetical protein